MAALTKSTFNAVGPVIITANTLTASDTFSYDDNFRTVIELRNATAGALSPVLDGVGGTTVGVAGIGPVSVASGYAVGSIAAGVTVWIEAANIAAYLQGVTTITGGSGIIASIVEFK